MQKKSNNKNFTDPKKVAKSINEDLAVDIKKLNNAIESLQTKHFYRFANRPLRLFGLAFIKGLITGMAAIIGATAMIVLLFYIVAHIPIIPGWLEDSLYRAVEIIEITKNN